jgi:predicted nucleic acid-binding protein
LIVADSSFLVEGLLKRPELFDEDTILTVDLAVYEVANSIWKHQYVLGDLKNGLPYLSIFHGLIEANKIRVVHPNPKLVEESYAVSARNKLSIYDAVFIALALEIGTGLETYDRAQAAVMRRESAR